MRFCELFDEFVLYARAANRSPRTIDSYAWQAKRFLRFLSESGHSDDCAQIATRVIREYVLYLQASYAPQTVANSVKAIKTIFAFGHSDELLPTDPTAKVSVPKVPSTDYQVFEPRHIDILLQTCDRSTVAGVRDFAIVLLLFDSGIRASELITLRDEHIDWSRGLVSVFGKGAKQRSVPVSSRTLRAIRRYIARRGYPDDGAPPTLFLSQRGAPLTRYGLAQLLHRLGERTGLHIHAHKLRHSFAVNALRNDAREFDIQDCLGHTTLTMTKRYARQTADDLVRRHKEFSPANRLRVRV